LKSTPPRCFGLGLGFFEEAEEEAAAPPFGRPMALAREKAGRSYYQALGGVRGRDSGGRGDGGGGGGCRRGGFALLSRATGGGGAGGEREQVRACLLYGPREPIAAGLDPLWAGACKMCRLAGIGDMAAHASSGCRLHKAEKYGLQVLIKKLKRPRTCMNLPPPSPKCQRLIYINKFIQHAYTHEV